MKEKRSHDLCLVGFLSSVLCSVFNLELFCLCEFSLSILISILRYIHRPAAPRMGLGFMSKSIFKTILQHQLMILHTKTKCSKK